MPGRGLGARAVRPELGQRAAVVAAEHDVRGVGLPGGGIDVVPVAVVRAERVAAPRARPDVERARRRGDRGSALRRITVERVALVPGGRRRPRASAARPGRSGRRRRRPAARSPRTWPQCGPTNDCTLPGLRDAVLRHDAGERERLPAVRVAHLRPGLGHDERRVRPACRSDPRSGAARARRPRARARCTPPRCGSRAQPASRPPSRRSRGGSRATLERRDELVERLLEARGIASSGGAGGGTRRS